MIAILKIELLVFILPIFYVKLTWLHLMFAKKVTHKTRFLRYIRHFQLKQNWRKNFCWVYSKIWKDWTLVVVFKMLQFFISGRLIRYCDKVHYISMRRCDMTMWSCLDTWTCKTWWSVGTFEDLSSSFFCPAWDCWNWLILCEWTVIPNQ